MTEQQIRRLIREEITAALRLLAAEFRDDALRDEHLVADQIELFVRRYTTERGQKQ
jgi:hypothetical protein